VIYLYNDTGVSEESLTHTFHSLKKIYPESSIRTINSKEVQDGNWINHAKLFILPGGADLPFVRKLKTDSIQNIQNFVNQGGKFIGICAGSYFASTLIEFDKGGTLEVIGKRELALFPGKAIGPVFGPYDYKTKSGARTAQISISGSGKMNLFFNGGCYFENAESYDGVTVMGRYQSGLPAVIKIIFGKGEVILSGVHFEYEPGLLDINDEYLQVIIPDLIKDNSKRDELAKNILTLN